MALSESFQTARKSNFPFEVFIKRREKLESFTLEPVHTKKPRVNILTEQVWLYPADEPYAVQF